MKQSVSYFLQPRPAIVGYGVELADVPCIAGDQEFNPGSLGAETVALPANLLWSVWQTVWTPGFPVVIFTGVTCGELSAADREVLWRRWGVPVYEQRLSAGGDLIAEECDAHEGLHVQPQFLETVVHEYRNCGCGYVGPMIPFRGVMARKEAVPLQKADRPSSRPPVGQDPN